VDNFKNGHYNRNIMTIAEWQGILGLIIGVAAVAGIVFTILRFYIKAFAKQELEDIRHELKPNSGSSMKDQVTRLEANQKAITETQKTDSERFDHKLDKLEDKVDKMFEIILKHFGHN
jgi:flagellar biosynthesis/type III secretory pathway M-ring protein FliF/YscJ